MSIAPARSASGLPLAKSMKTKRAVRFRAKRSVALVGLNCSFSNSVDVVVEERADELRIVVRDQRARVGHPALDALALRFRTRDEITKCFAIRLELRARHRFE